MSEQVAQIAERIRELREISGRTVEQVATLISIPVADYEALEAGTYDVPISVLLKLSSLYHVDTNTILTGEAPKMNIFALTRKGMGVDIRQAYPLSLYKPGLQLRTPQDRTAAGNSFASVQPGAEDQFALRP